jgi:RecB family exonuclease
MTPGILDCTLELTPIRRISPSRYEGFKACALREAWAAAGQGPLLPLTPAARIGMAIHQLLEEAGRGQLAPAERPAIERRWEELLAKVEAAMSENWLERQFVPVRSAVPDLEVRRLRAQERALAIAQAAGVARRAAPEKAVTGFERWVESPDGTVGGYIDHVMATPEGPVLRDYKSGSVRDVTPGGPAGLREGFVAQLRLYAALYAAAAGVWPARLELVPLQGETVAVPFDPAECEALLADAVAVLGWINAIIAAPTGSAQEAEARLATPSVGACRHCPFRPACAAYRLARTGAPEDGTWPEDAWGELREVRRLGNGKLLLTLGSGSEGGDSRQVRGISPDVDRHPALEHLREGEQIALFNLKGAPAGGTRSESLWTVIYKVPGTGDRP